MLILRSAAAIGPALDKQKGQAHRYGRALDTGCPQASRVGACQGRRSHNPADLLTTPGSLGEASQGFGMSGCASGRSPKRDGVGGGTGAHHTTATVSSLHCHRLFSLPARGRHVADGAWVGRCSRRRAVARPCVVRLPGRGGSELGRGAPDGGGRHLPPLLAGSRGRQRASGARLGGHRADGRGGNVAAAAGPAPRFGTWCIGAWAGVGDSTTKSHVGGGARGGAAGLGSAVQLWNGRG